MTDDDVLSAEAVEFLHLLSREFEGERQELLAARQARARRLREGELPAFLDATRTVREGTGASRRPPPTWRTGASRSPGRRIARW